MKMSDPELRDWTRRHMGEQVKVKLPAAMQRFWVVRHDHNAVYLRDPAAAASRWTGCELRAQRHDTQDGAIGTIVQSLGGKGRAIEVIAPVHA